MRNDETRKRLGWGLASSADVDAATSGYATKEQGGVTDFGEPARKTADSIVAEDGMGGGMLGVGGFNRSGLVRTGRGVFRHIKAIGG